MHFRDRFTEGERKRLYVLFGSSGHLRIEARDTIRAATAYRPGDRVVLDAKDMHRVWLEASTYPQTTDTERLVEADATGFGSVEWEQANAWLDARDIPQVRVVLEIDRPDLGDNPELRRLVKRSACKQVRCAPLNESDAVEWIRTVAGCLSANQAWRVLERTGDELAARDAARAIAAVAGDNLDVPQAVTDLLARPHLTGEFAAALMTGDKPGAIELAQAVPHDDYGWVIARLDAQVEVARRLHETQQIEFGTRAIADLSRTSGIPINLVREVAGVARHFTDARARRATVALAVVDDAVRRGARTGVLEALTAMF